MIDVRIDELVLDGVSGLEPDAIRAATEAELAEPASPFDLSSPSFAEQPEARRVGRQLANTIRREVTAATSRTTGTDA
jgi:hypothetical protein